MTRMYTWVAAAGLTVALTLAGGCKSDRSPQGQSQPTLGGDAAGRGMGGGNDRSVGQNQNNSVNSLH